MSIDTIGNFLTIIRNGIMASLPDVKAPYSNLKYQIASILKDEGYIWDFGIEGEGAHKSLKVVLKYVDGESAIHEITRVSKPGRRVYKGVSSLEPVIGGLGIAIITTPRGVITNKKARQLAVGGEVICTVW
jgi:small subunit ribosomal protein S8